MANLSGNVSNTSDEEQLIVYLHANPLAAWENEDGKKKIAVDQLPTAKEIDIIKRRLDRSGRQFRFRSAVATLENVAELVGEGCRMLHYAGHGRKDFLGFESDRHCGIMEPVKVTSLTNLFKTREFVPKMVFCGSCDSRLFGEALVEAGVRHVVAVDIKDHDGLSDQVAQNFTYAFYDALIVGDETVKSAFEYACEHVKAVINAAPSFVLLPQGADHDVRIFERPPKGKFVDLTRPLPPIVNEVVARPEYFGMVELQRVIEMLGDQNTRCVSITGEPGVGKTARALNACKYIQERHRFDKIVAVSCRQVMESASGLPRPTSRAGRPEHMKYLCRLIGSAVGMPRSEVASSQALLDFLTNGVTSIKNVQPKVLIFLDDVDHLFDGRGSVAHDSLVCLLNQMFCLSQHVWVLLTCEQHILGDTLEFFQNTVEKICVVKPLRPEDAAGLLRHLFSREGRGFKCGELGVMQGTRLADGLRALASHDVVRESRGHPGTLVKLSPDLRQYSLNDGIIRELIRHYQAEFRNRSRLKFSEKSAGEVAYKKGLRNERCRRIWVEAVATAAKRGLDVCTVCAISGPPSWYHVVPVDFLLPLLQGHLAEVQAAQSNTSETQTPNDDRYSYICPSALSNAADDQRRFRPTVEPFTPRAMDGEEVSFVYDILMSKQKDFREARGCSCGVDCGDTISIEAFVQFCKWWEKTMATISRMLADWMSMSPIKIHGFVSRKRAERMLRKKEPGTFLLRFSESKPGLMVMSVIMEASRDVPSSSNTSQPAVKHFGITDRPVGQWYMWDYPAVSEILQDLVLSWSELRKVYPDIPKEDVFTDAPRAI